MGQGASQRRQLAWAHRAQRDTRRDSFQIGYFVELGRQTLPQVLARKQLFDAFVALGGLHTIAQRMMQPVPQAPAAHRRCAMVEQFEQRRPVFAAQRLGDLQVAARDRIERNEVRDRLTLQRSYVR